MNKNQSFFLILQKFCPQTGAELGQHPTITGAQELLWLFHSLEGVPFVPFLEHASLLFAFAKAM
jgi:hypothetical protein